MDEQIPSPRKIELQIVTMVLIVAMFAVLGYYVYFGIFMGAPLGDPESWGQFGDYLGGLINPAVGIATVLLVARTLQATRQEAKDTRTELEEQTKHLSLQLKSAEKLARLDEIKKRLDGALDDWRAEMARPVGNLPPLRTEIGRPGSRDGLNTYQFLIDVDPETDFRYGLLHNIDPQAVKVAWNKRFEDTLQILDEIIIYCSEYENLSEDRAMTDYYRKRIQKVARLFREMGLIDIPTFEKLRVGLRFSEYSSN